MTRAVDLEGDRVLSDVFLSPRVVDRGAFEEYATRLRSIISEASGEAARLRESAAGSLSLREELKSATTRTADQAQRAVELARLLGERVASLQRSLAEAGALADRLGGFEARLEEAARSRLAAFEDRIAAKVESLVARAESEAMGRVLARFAAVRDGASSGVEKLQRSLDGAVEFTDRLAEQHGTMRREAEMLLAAARDALRPIEEATKVRDAVTADLSELAESIRTIAGRTRKRRART